MPFIGIDLSGTHAQVDSRLYTVRRYTHSSPRYMHMHTHLLLLLVLALCSRQCPQCCHLLIPWQGKQRRQTTAITLHTSSTTTTRGIGCKQR